MKKTTVTNFLSALLIVAFVTTTAIYGCKKEDNNNSGGNYTVTVNTASVNATEGVTAQVSVTINPQPTENIALNLSFTYNTASAADIIVPATYTISKGQTNATVTFEADKDFENESNETGTLTITSGASNITVVNGTVAVTIVNSTSTPSSRFLSGLLDGSNFAATGIHGGTATLMGCGSGGVDGYVSTGGTWVASLNPTKNSAKVLMHKIFPGGSQSVNASTHYGMIAPGSYGFATNAQNNSDCSFTNGARIVVYDSNNQEWSTAWGDNTGSTFKITFRDTYPGSTAINTTFAGTYNCKVYNSSGSMKTLSGSFYSYAGLQH